MVVTEVLWSKHWISLFQHFTGSSIFTARCLHKRGLYKLTVVRCPSVSLVSVSVTFAYCVESTKHILKLFSLSASSTILVFFLPNLTATFRRGPPNGSVECRGMKNRDFPPISVKNRDFPPISRTRFILEMIQDRAIVTTERTNRNSYAIYWMVSFAMTWMTPNPDFNVVKLFRAEYFLNGTI